MRLQSPDLSERSRSLCLEVTSWDNMPYLTIVAFEYLYHSSNIESMDLIKSKFDCAERSKGETEGTRRTSQCMSSAFNEDLLILFAQRSRSIY